MVSKVWANGQAARILAGTRTLLHGAGRVKWALIDQVGVSGCNFATNILLARVLGIEEFGRYVLAWTVVAIIQGLQYSAISSTMLSIGPKHDADSAQSYFGALFVHQGIFALASATLTFIGGQLAAAAFPASGLDVIGLAVAVAVLCSQTQDFLRRYFFSIDRPEVSFAIDAVRYFGQNIALLAMIKWLPATNITALWLIAAVATLSSVAAIPWIPPLQYSLAATLSAGLRGWHFSKWLVASTILVLTIGNLFFFASGLLLGAAAVGAMKAAQNLVGIAHIVIEAGVNIIPSRASREFVSGGQGALINYLTKVTIYGVAAIASLVGIFAIAPGFWLQVFFGPQFEPYRGLVPWWGAIQILLFLGLVIGSWFRTLEKTRVIFYANALSAAVSLALAYPLIKYFGVTGAVAGLVIANIVQLLFLLAQARRACRVARRNLTPGRSQNRA
jgi:Membrane protein involved in the export of O-antigen and teichoic acid